VLEEELDLDHKGDSDHRIAADILAVEVGNLGLVVDSHLHHIEEILPKTVVRLHNLDFFHKDAYLISIC